ncbi:HD superfamily phosphohydrolase [Halorubrum alkaliphilum]|uniref:HD superfamily phosphohydrolase n=1 Tax=Halorubrum alkaliphilum TaxID=261290 RepID=A0A8T4GGM9_9EURY|nr:HD domain-containing protein [Halorubrum alkaliphilum]MBP1922322.1 HD superfamily phosphohydrolase [Halorubrum alkaliphilum]
MGITQIKDPVHGYVELPDALVDGVVDTRPFQRLRYVRQLSATHLVYPGANHTRFEHSLGVYHLGRTVFENLRGQSYFTRDADIDEIEEIQRTLECACLLHDVGHPPFSHLSEGLLDETTLRERIVDTGLVDAFDEAGVGGEPLRAASPHELLGCVLIVEEYGDAIRAFDVDPFEVCGYVLGYSLAYERGEAWQYGVGAQLLHSPIDVDRLDYITRDNRMTGAGVLSFDVDRMVDAYTAHPEEGLALTEKALSTIGNYLEGRIALYMWVTQHHKAVYANRLLQAMLGEYEAETGESPVTVDGVLGRELDDNTVLERLRIAARENPDSTLASMYDRFRGRRFPDTCWKHRIALADRIGSELGGRTGDLDDFTAWLVAEDDRLERMLAEALDVPTHEVWIDRSYVPAYDPDELEDIPIAYGGTTRSVGEWGLYGDRAFDVPIPFVFVPEGTKRTAIRLLRETFADETDEKEP